MSKFEKNIGKPKLKDVPLDETRPIPGKRKKSEDKRTWEERLYVCPFCGGFIPPMPQKEKARHFWSWERERVCPTCKAFRIEDACPACKRDTWFKPDDTTITTGEYAHAWGSGCGFRGRKLV